MKRPTQDKLPQRKMRRVIATFVMPDESSPVDIAMALDYHLGPAANATVWEMEDFVDDILDLASAVTPTTPQPDTKNRS